MTITRSVFIFLLVFSAGLNAQKNERTPPSRPSRSEQHPAPRANSAPVQHQSAGSQRSTPSGSTVHQGSSQPSTSNSVNRNNSGNTNGGARSGSTQVFTPNNRGNGDRGNGGNATPSTPAANGNNRPGGTTVYSPNNANRNPGGNNSNPAVNSNTRPGNNTPSGGFNRNGVNTPAGGFNRGTYNSTPGNGGRTNFPPKATIYHAPGGGQVHTRSDGSIREVRTANGATIYHAPGGVRRVEVVRPGGRVIVANTRGAGYVQRPLVISNRTYVQRTYVVGGVSYARVYRPWVYGGFTYHVYTPMRFWSPGFYSYAYSPWARPVYYGWGWGASPWYGYYGGWFTPYPYYTSPAFWLTDYLIAETLRDAYESRAAAAANAQANYGATPLTPEVKQAVADEVKRQLDQERAEQQYMNSPQAGGPPPIFSGNGPHVFVVANSMDVDSGGQMCPVSEGDVLQLNSAPPSNATYAQVVVLASKGPDCRKGSTVSVALSDLQEMQNQMRATIDQGLSDLQKKQGQGGLPTLPASAAAQPVNAPYAAQVQPDANAATELSQASQEADRAERDVVDQSMQNGTPLRVSLGQSIADVEAAMGKPRDIADLGSKKIYVYRDLKITFVDGKVTDVQ